ncbi:hypothetical protein Tco_0724731, partial [Tanacetum coccineum]
TESSGSYTTQAVDADIGPVHDDEPFADVCSHQFRPRSSS